MPRLAAAAALVLALACAHSPAPPPGPRPLTGAIQIHRNDASLELALRYEVRDARQLEISAELTGAGSGSVGPVAVELRPEGLALDGPAAWTGEAAAGQRAHNTWRLVAGAPGVARVEIRHGLAGAEPTTTTAAFRVEADAIRLCAAADCADEAD